MTKFKLNTKQINPFFIKSQNFDEYLKANRVNIINLGVDKPLKRFFDMQETSGQTSRHGPTSKNEIETGQNQEKMMTIGDYEEETGCTC